MRNVTALASATRTASVNSSDIKTEYKGCNVVIDMTAVSTGGSVTLDSGAPTASSATIQLASVTGEVHSTGTVTCASVLANTFSTGTITCASVLEHAFATGTVTMATVTAGETVTINGLSYTAVSGTKADNTEWDISGGDNAAATDLTDSVNNDGRAGTSGDISAVASSAVVTFTTDVAGSGGNAITLVSTDGTMLAVSGATLSGGNDADTVTVNGNIYIAVSGTKSNNTEFSTDTSNDATATDLADSITNDIRSGTAGDVTATAATNVVTCTTDIEGTAGDAVTLASTDGVTLAVSGATFASGVDADTGTINGNIYTAVAGAKADNTEFSIDTSNDAAATDLADSITNDSRSGTLNDVTATAATNVVTCTQTVGGAGGDATTLASSNGTRLALSGATFGSGVTGDFVVVNGLTYTATVGARADDTEFSVDTSDTAAATDLAAAITADTRTGTLNDVTASSLTDTVTCTQTVAGAGGDATTLAESTSGARITISGATFGSGVTASVDSITVDGVNVMSSVEVYDTDLNTTATNVAANITANTSAPNYSATASGAVITIASVIGGDTFVVVSTTTTIVTTDADMDATGSVVFKLQGKDGISGAYYDIIESALVEIIETRVLKIYPGVTVAANVSVSEALPKYVRVVATHSGSESMAYSVALNYLL